MTKHSPGGLSRIVVVMSLAVVAIGMPGIGIAGPGCLHDQRMSRGINPDSPVLPPAAYGPAVPYPYFARRAPYPGTLAIPCSGPLIAGPDHFAAVGMSATAAAVEAKSDRESGGTSAGDSNKAIETVTVHINGMRFEPESITVKPGTTVTWMHAGRMPRSSAGNAEGLGSNTLCSGQKYSHTFTEEDVYNYFCSLHPAMTGGVFVETDGKDG
jgi:plastocyanin